MGGVFQMPTLKPLPPEQTYERVVGQILSSAKRSREDFQAMVKMMRHTNPTLIQHLTDEQAAEKLETEWKRKVREAVQRVYHQQGRSAELTHRVG